ncbi:NUDIX hydrolase [Propionibacteriaceae bacterium Y1923]
MPDLQVHLELHGDVGRLHWDGHPEPAVLTRAVSLCADDAILGQGARRVEAEVQAGDWPGRRALQRAGFRREGIRRQALQVGDSYVDTLLYARLATDPVHGPMGFSGVMNSVLATKRVISHVVFTDEQSRVLLLETTYKKDFELPGGVVEPAESPRRGAIREVAEEIGLVLNLAGPALVDWMPPSLGWSDALEFLFDAGVLDEQAVSLMRLDPGEIRAAHWLAADQLEGTVSELSSRRIRAVLAARVPGRRAPAVFTEDGRAY